ncbi:hypothetical protein AVEN_228697-1 [Araneus ventricosus]|uniref:Uncharacterized protein n=1 Tax=Araneus ventricosus TaxID=182803 RepID=A0A4Y2LQC3_ARAVE|nr:hypothetical protein AVEN_228697-1 [Araneus ventricosus]
MPLYFKFHETVCESRIKLAYTLKRVEAEQFASLRWNFHNEPVVNHGKGASNYPNRRLLVASEGSRGLWRCFEIQICRVHLAVSFEFCREGRATLEHVPNVKYESHCVRRKIDRIWFAANRKPPSTPANQLLASNS